MIEAGIRIIPTSVSPVNDYGNFALDSPYRELQNINFRFTNRNTQPLQAGDYYILRFNFDLRNDGNFSGSFQYPYSTYSNSGNAIFLRNCQTILLQVGTTALGNFIPLNSNQPNKLNVLISSLFYTPSTILSTIQSVISGYAVYMSTLTC
jgi:hypothetical protein